jgi:2-methylcitrate dehydratase PrpD
MTIIERLAEFVAALNVDSAGAETMRAARYQVLDMVAAARFARDVPEAAGVVRACAALGEGAGKATVVATGERLPPAAAAAANACFAMAHDFDDIIWAGHTCHASVFAAMAVAEHEGCATDAFLLAVIAGNEVAGRLGASSYFGPLNGQMTTYIHLLGAAAAAAKLLQLDAKQTAHALAISLAQPNFALQPAFMGPSSKLLSAAVPIGTGLRAAYLAREGIEGHLGIIEGARGFWHHFSFLRLPVVFDDLGKFWATQTLSLKEYPGCHYFQTACEAFAALTAGRDVASIRRIDVATTKLACEASAFGAEYRGAALTPIDVNFNLTTTLAVLAQAGDLGKTELAHGWLAQNRQAIDAWSTRIHVKHDPALTMKVLRSGGAIESGRRALQTLTPRKLLHLVRRYRESYASRLIRRDEAVAWLRALANREPVATAATNGAVPLAFPSRVTITWASGETSESQVDFPAGTFAHASCEDTLRRKWLKTGGTTASFVRGLDLGATSLGDFLGTVASDPT